MQDLVDCWEYSLAGRRCVVWVIVMECWLNFTSSARECLSAASHGR